MKDKTTIKLQVGPIAKGHAEHRSGAGKHLDRRTKRNRTRQTQSRNAIREW